jgi:hypothetical protein
MTTTTELPAETGTRPYPLLARQALAADRDRLLELARETGIDQKDWPWLALRALRTYRVAMNGYRDALVEHGLLRPLPAPEFWNEAGLDVRGGGI